MRDGLAHEYLEIHPSAPLSGTMQVEGAKNAVLVTMASLLLTSGKSLLRNVPASSDVLHMIRLLEQLGAAIIFDTENHILEVDTTAVHAWHVSHDIMKKMRASILVMGPLLARFKKVQLALPGGCVIGKRPIDLHLVNLRKMGVSFSQDKDALMGEATALRPARIVLEYPSVGATENILMASVLAPGRTFIINAALEPEVIDLIAVLSKMGAKITIGASATITIDGVDQLRPLEHSIMPDRLEAGALLCAAAITGGSIEIPNCPPHLLDVFLYKLEQMGHTVDTGGTGITLTATKDPRAVSFKTGPYPGFPTDLQAPFMALQTIAQGQAVVEETVFENRMLHTRELNNMGAQINCIGTRAEITGVDQLYGCTVIATDIRASCALALAGFVADGVTKMSGLHHWRRGYESLESKLNALGASIYLRNETLTRKEVDLRVV